jgi:MSHA biogenesis protein MshJ
MKQYWQKAVVRIDGLTLRERLIIFLMAALALVTAMNMLVLDPHDAEQKRIAKRIQDEQVRIARIRAEIQQTISARATDPDAVNRTRLRALQQQRAELQQNVAGIQRGLISPDKMAALLENILKSNTRLRLAHLKKLPVTNLAEMPEGGSAPTRAAETAGLYRHGVELTVQGSYPDILGYLAALERLPSQLVWGEVVFAVDKHPASTMTLTVYTLSLDKQWLHI